MSTRLGIRYLDYTEGSNLLAMPLWRGFAGTLIRA